MSNKPHTPRRRSHRTRRRTALVANRFDKARMLVKLGGIKSLREDKTGRIINALVPGSEAKTYEVIARREGRNYIETECLLQTGAGAKDCRGGWSAVCYHALAVLLTSAQNNNYTAAICKSQVDADRRKNIGGKVFQVKSKHAPQNPLWIVANPILPKLELKSKDTPTPKTTDQTTKQIIKELGY